MRIPNRITSVLVAFLVIALAGCSAGLRQAGSPEEVGLSSERLREISAAFQSGVDKREIPGAVVMIARHGKIAYLESFGFRDREAAAPMTPEAIFRIASMTKPVTSVAVMMLVEQGRLGLDEPVARYLPEFSNLQVGVERKDAAGKVELVLERPQREMTVRDLLRHTSGLTYGFFGKSLVKERYNAANVGSPAQTNADLTAKLARLPLQYHPGTTWDYSMSTDVLGRIVEVVAGKELGAFFADAIFEPLGMRDTAFWLDDPARQSRLAQAQADPKTGKRPALPDKSAKHWQSGGGGLVSTIGDYARFCQMLLNGGELGGARILSRESLSAMASDQLPSGIRRNHFPVPVVDVRAETGHSFGLGFLVRTADGRSEFPGSVGDYSWTGIFGTQFWVDPRKDLFAIMMVQVPATEGALRSRYWTQTRKLVYGAVTD